MKNNVIALVPIKRQSKRLENKNIKQFNEMPLLYWVLESLKKSQHVEQIIVDTDSKEISNRVLNYFPSIKIFYRPTELCGDNISMNLIIENDISNICADHFLQTHVTNPLLKTKTVDQAITSYFKNFKLGFDSLFSVTEIKKRLYDSSNNPINHDPQKLIDTQNLNPIYEENSNIYIFSKKSFKSNKNNRIGRKPFLFPMDPIESIDIDYDHEFILAELSSRIMRQMI